MAIKKEKSVAATKEEGVVYVASTGQHFTAPEITAELISDLKDNIYAKGLARKQINLIFTKKYYLEVLDAKGVQDEDLELKMTRMCEAPDVKLWSKMKKSWLENYWFGPGLFNQVWNYGNDGIYTLRKLRHLPSESFYAPPENGPLEIFSQILQGIILNEEKEIEYYQTQKEDESPVKVENIYMIKEPTSTKLAGEPLILPLIPVISMLKYVWDTQMAQANRTGTKILFLKVTKPQEASKINGYVSDLDHAKEILENWGNDTGYTLRENMEIIDPQIKDDSNNLEIIEALNQMLIDFISPINFLTAANDAARLGGSDNQRMEMILRWIESEHTWLEEDFSALLQPYLDVNKFVDYTVKVHIPVPELDTSELDLKRAKEGRESKVWFPNEVRVLLGGEPLDEEGLGKLEEYYKRTQPEQPQFGFMTKTPKDQTPPTAIEEIRNVGGELADKVIEALEFEE